MNSFTWVKSSCRRYDEKQRRASNQVRQLLDWCNANLIITLNPTQLLRCRNGGARIGSGWLVGRHRLIDFLEVPPRRRLFLQSTRPEGERKWGIFSGVKEVCPNDLQKHSYYKFHIIVCASSTPLACTAYNEFCTSCRGLYWTDTFDGVWTNRASQSGGAVVFIHVVDFLCGWRTRTDPNGQFWCHQNQPLCRSKRLHPDRSNHRRSTEYGLW